MHNSSQIQENTNHVVLIDCLNKSQIIPKGQSKMANPEKLTTQDTQDEKKQNKHNM